MLVMDKLAITKIQAMFIVTVIVVATVASVATYFFVAPPPAPETIRIGIAGPMTAIQGIGMREGAMLAAEEINEAGGVLGRKIELFFEDTEEADPAIPVDRGVAAVERLITINKVHLIIGGFRSDVVIAIQDKIADFKIPFINIGAASVVMTKRVLEDYDRYKYFFRSNPLNSTALAISLIQFYGFLRKALGFSKVYILAEDAAWTRALAPVLEDRLPKLGWEIVSPEGKADFFPLGTTDFSAELTRIRNSGAEAILTLISAGASIPFIKQWNDLKVPALPAGIDVLAQVQDFWGQTDGKARYEVLIINAGATGAPVTPKSQAFFKKYVENFGRWPVYTASGAYDAVYIAAEAIERAGSLDPDAIVKALEETDFVGVGGRIVFTRSHDLMFGPGFATAAFVQWRGFNERVTVWPPDIKTGDIELPPWMKRAS